MRLYLLTEPERKALRNYIETGKKDPSIRQIRHKGKKSLPGVIRDLVLICDALRVRDPTFSVKELFREATR